MCSQFGLAFVSFARPVFFCNFERVCDDVVPQVSESPPQRVFWGFVLFAPLAPGTCPGKIQVCLCYEHAFYCVSGVAHVSVHGNAVAS